MRSEKEIIQCIRENIVRLKRAIAEAEYKSMRYLEQADNEASARISEAVARNSQDLTAIRGEHERTLQQIVQEYSQRLATLDVQRKKLFSRVQNYWTDPSWQSWKPERNAGKRLLARIGQLVEPEQTQSFIVPLCPLLGDRRPLVIKGPGVARASAVQSIQSLLLGLLTVLPPGRLHFTFIDPVGLGQNAAAFMHLVDYDEALINSRAWMEESHIGERLGEFTESMELFIRQNLRNEYTTIEDYNDHASEVAEPYRLLVVFDFPVNFSEAYARRLVSIASNGPRCGIYTVVLVDTEQPLPRGFNLGDLERVSSVIAWNGSRFVLQDNDFQDCRLKLDSPPEPELFSYLVRTVGTAAKDANRVEVPFERTTPRQESWWTGNSNKGLQVALGPVGPRELQHLALRGGNSHMLLAGRTGSGKSTLLHVMITNLALTYSPDEVEMYLIDFKEGVEFKVYATYKLPHIRVVAIESEREFGLSVLQGLDSEVRRRGDLFRENGVDELADYREKTGKPLPRILLLVDEFQRFFAEDDFIASQSSQLLDRLVRQGRAFGIHVVLSSQSLAGHNLARSTIDQIAVRIALLCSDTDSRLILAEDNPAARLLSRPGEAIYNAAMGRIEGNNRFQVAWLPDDKREQYLKRIEEMTNSRKYEPREPQIVFEGNAVAHVENNRLLKDLIEEPGWPQPNAVHRLWLGDPVKISQPVEATFHRQSSSNLLIVGRNAEAAFGMLATGLVSLVAQVPEEKRLAVRMCPNFYILDFSTSETPYADFLTLKNYLGCTVVIGRRRELPELVSEVAAELQRRSEKDDTSASAIYFLIYGLQRARELRDEEFGAFAVNNGETASPSVAKQFQAILRDGPEMGIHILAWCDTLANLERTFDRRTMREFGMCVGLQMDEKDSSNLLDTPAAGRLGQNRAIFVEYDEGRLEKFRPYVPPSQGWLQSVGQRLQAKNERPSRS